ncbi:transcriptional regulator [Cellvibrio zantedeschiae]|uniref:Transcriptional regulator n=1 Tax=Cellvibrio zantedeschiae TaxID=1237077 RepID=A0ABQ3BAY0_9GAMM|nr:hydrogen peroxide-inducible genes activator [Cellvibrio zantedeschiae]GGY88418.1 transcriptional regulator [Cellvibrio zantedeschiae]
MTLIELRYLVTLAQTQHFGRAAELCNISQSALSMAVRKLEDNLGVLLFERSKSGIRATQMGEQIIAQAQRVISQADAITALAAADKDQLSGELKLGAIFTLGPSLLPQLIPSLRLIANQLSLTCYEGYNSDLREKLRTGELDAILISQPFTEADIVSQEVYSEPLQLVMPLNHPLAAKKSIGLNDLEDQTFLLLSDKQCLRTQMLAVYPAAQNNSIECSSLDTLRHMIALGLGVSILPSSATSSALFSAQALSTRPLQGQPKRKISLAWRASFPRHKAIDAVRRAIQACTWQFTTAHDTSSSGLLVENASW